MCDAFTNILMRTFNENTNWYDLTSIRHYYNQVLATIKKKKKKGRKKYKKNVLLFWFFFPIHEPIIYNIVFLKCN